MFTIVGLGNPEKEHASTRHNAGWLTLSRFIEENGLPEASRSSRYEGLLSEGQVGGRAVAVLMPTTYMNNSGTSVAKYVKEKGALDELVVVHDDVDLAWGDVKISAGRGAGGHNGVQSVIDHLGTKEFVRVRVGIAKRGFFGGVKRPTGEDLAAFVLSPFSAGELKALPDIAKRVADALTTILEHGAVRAMQEVNGL
ncbi:MAG TPA: aminoacyl-tRNA hydrolase [Candidatus Paceibacterota bacterium]|nr:aminoacyl-tRNA hydrolase [Candidatus Paceibacterota bacterium]